MCVSVLNGDSTAVSPLIFEHTEKYNEVTAKLPWM